MQSYKHSLLGLSLLLLFFSVTTTFAQSGRRGASSKPLSVPTPEPEPSPQKPNRSDEDDPIKVIVGIDRGSGFEFIPLEFYSAALYGCSDRLDESALVQVTGTQQDFSRGEAVNRAKKERETYIVWLNLRGENSGVERTSNNRNEMILDYTVFAPTTGKIIASGRTYQRAARVGGVIVSPPGSGRADPIYGEYMVKQAARDAAERILSRLDVPTNGKKIPAP
jgi:hypothetical protein